MKTYFKNTAAESSRMGNLGREIEGSMLHDAVLVRGGVRVLGRRCHGDGAETPEADYLLSYSLLRASRRDTPLLSLVDNTALDLLQPK
jgi:hypothetical protein